MIEGADKDDGNSSKITIISRWSVALIAGVAYVARFTGARAGAYPVEALNRRVRHRKVRTQRAH